MKNEEKDNTIVDNQLYNISLRLSDVSIENIIMSNQSIFKASRNIEELKNDNFSNHKKYVPTDKKSGRIHYVKHENSVIKKENIANKLSINNTIDTDYITNLIHFIGSSSRGQSKQIRVNNLFNYQEMNLTPSYETMPISYKSNIDCNYHSRLILSKRTFNKKIEMPSLENLQKNKCIKNNFINYNENKELKYFFKKWGKTHYVDISINKKFQCYRIFSFNPSDSLVDNRIHSYLNNNSNSEKNLLIIRKDNKDQFNEKSDKY
ncbi:SpaN/EivJ family type III secretion system needle length determinant [Arsenophonus sp. PmNCSU2021_1]|uniref:SpaN/EivJ family type III secretion system needle length determinant n=1 Tax=Arsenophonus sp. PmNCSU2021_1 TaxID=3118989 RepID=UPI002FF227E5